MHRISRIVLWPLAAGLLLLYPGVAAGQALDQSQETRDNAHAVDAFFATWQTFTPAISGPLASIELLLRRHSFDPPAVYGDLSVAVVATAGDLPTAIELGSVTVAPAAVSEDEFEWVSVDFSASQVELVAGTVYAIRLTSPETPSIPGHDWAFADEGDPYAAGAFFRDTDAEDGLDDPSVYLGGADATFRTYMSVCGNGAPEAGEECDDGNLAGGDGCSASCRAEVCGDGAVLGPESCDDANTAAGDGCSDVCQLEDDAAACQKVIAKAGAKYAATRLAALQKCRAQWVAGKALAIPGPGECAADPPTASRIERAAAKARRKIASGKRPKCSDTLLPALSACADSVDALIAADAASGCLLSTHDAAVGALLEAEYGY